jgi:LysM repeat protein
LSVNQPCPQGTTPYIIRAGDTYFSLAQRFNTTVAAITAANPGVDPNRLVIGQRICMPGTTPPPVTCPTGFTTYTIRAGDTLYALAIRFNTTVAVLIQANPGINPNALFIGQQICVPGTTPPPVTCPTGFTTYTIRAGDTLYALAIRFNTTVNVLLQANPGINPNALFIGQQICVPSGPPPVTCPTGFTTYTIRAGDTLYAIAIRFNTTVNVLLQANPGINPNALFIGQRICVPGTTPPPVTCPTGFTTYTIVAGDTLFAIANRFNTTVNVLLQANPGINPNALFIGQRICVPATT